MPTFRRLGPPPVRRGTALGRLKAAVMQHNRFEAARRAGSVPVGHMLIEFGTRGIARLTAAADVDFVVVDMEQSGFGLDRIADLAAWFHGTHATPFVRIPQGHHHFIARSLDVGMRGIVVPNVESADEARAIVASAKYPPLGMRGIALGAAHADYGVANAAAFLASANDDVSVICQIESVAGVANAAAIAAVEGVSALWLGHNDLSSSLGRYGTFEDPQFVEALRSIVRAARASGKAAMAHATSVRQLETWLGLGFDAVCWRMDAAVYREALRGEIATAREVAGRPRAAT